MSGTVSVVMCTYNGERYIQEQLCSIANQTQLPDELIVCDDCSFDRSFEIIEEFARIAPFKVSVYMNVSRQGSTKAFEFCSRKCHGEIVFFCDQDDFWETNKIEKIVRVMHSQPDVNLVFSDARLSKNSLDPVYGNLQSVLKIDAKILCKIRSNAAFTEILRRNTITGATMAVRKCAIAIADPFPDEWFHDNWIAIITAAYARLEYIDEPLIIYRQHETNQIGVEKHSVLTGLIKSKKVTRDYYRMLAARHRVLRQRLIMLKEERGIDLAQQIAQTSQKIAHLEHREHLSNILSIRFVQIIKEFASGHYSRYSEGMRSAVRDLIFGG